MKQHVFVGFGFGPIQGGLFAAEAYASGNFRRIVVAEIDEALVAAVRANGGRYAVNVAHTDRVEVVEVAGVELLNPADAADDAALGEVLRQATEIATCLPAVRIFTAGGDKSVAGRIAEGLEHSEAPGTIVYTGENDNHAAEKLEEAVVGRMNAAPGGKVQFLNTVIGKMSRVVTDEAEVKALGLAPIAPGIGRAFLVEAFNRILVTRCVLEGFAPGIEVFIEKDDLLPFEEAKLYGHNAIHALLAYLGALAGCDKMRELAERSDIMAVGHDAFIKESGAALCRKYARMHDELFTPAGYRDYAEDLLERMTNPHLEDTIARAARDPVRKLGYADRIFGTMALACAQGVRPENMALGAAAGLAALLGEPDEYELPVDLRLSDWRQLDAARVAALCRWLWRDIKNPSYAEQLIELTAAALPRLPEFAG